jgi:diguanylate cyclase (GGDEF)-like protein
MNEPGTDTPGDRASGKLKRLLRTGPVEVAPNDSAPPSPVDPVTGLPTRSQLRDALVEAVAASHGKSAVAVLAFIEAGALRDINDTMGPDVGDHLLRLTGERLVAIDVPGSAVIRYEGAVFGVVLPDIPNLTGAETAAQFLVEHLSVPFEIGGVDVHIGPTVGAAVSTDNYRDLDDMIRDAFQAYTEARDAGHGAFVVHDESKRARYSTRIDDRRLQDAIEQSEFELYYQPMLRLDASELVGVEALIRWIQPGTTNVGMLYPHDFLPLLEKSGRMVEVGRWVLDTACQQVAAWERIAPDTPKLFVTCNVGARELADARLPDTVLSAVQASGIQPWQLCLDITEDALRFNRFQRESVWARLRRLSDHGVKLCLDDFGTGMASLSVLREMRVDLVRIDRLFVSGLGVAQEDDAIVKHVASLTHDLGCLAIAEGVETLEQAGRLLGLGVDIGQGFLYGRPETATQIAERLRPGSTAEPDAWDASNVLPG